MNVNAHELWAMAQLAPGEGVEDGVQRIERALAARQTVVSNQSSGNPGQLDVDGQTVWQEPVAWIAPVFFDHGTRGFTALREPPSERSIELNGEYVPLYAAPPAQGVHLGQISVIECLLRVAYAAWNLADNTEDDGVVLNVAQSDFYNLAEALDKLDELPDDQPGYVMEGAAKARWALRAIIDQQRDSVAGVK